MSQSLFDLPYQECLSFQLEKDERCFVVGDIHGHFDKLISGIKENNITDKDILICNGDMINRHLDTPKVLDFLLTKSNVILVCGNHELSFLRIMNHIVVNGLNYKKAREDIIILNHYIEEMGGSWTKQLSFVKLFEYASLLSNKLVSSVEVDVMSTNKKIGIAHSGMYNYDWEYKENVEYNSWSFEQYNDIQQKKHKNIKGIDYAVFGHVPVEKKLISNNSIYIDTGSYNGYRNKLTFLNLEELK